MEQQTDPRIGLQKAEALYGAGRYRAAATAFERLADQDGCRASAQRGWRALAQLDNIEEAVSHFAAAIDADPGDEDTYSELRYIWGRLKSPDELLGRIQHRIAGLGSASAHAALAGLLDGLNWPEAALAEHARAAEIEPKSAALQTAWAVALDASERHDEAVQQCAIAISLIDGELDDADPFVPLTSSLRALQAADDAVARIQKVIDAGDRAELRLRWAGALYAVGRADDGAQEYEKVAADPARRVEAVLAWANALEYAGDPQAALLKFEEAITLDPACEEGFANVVWLAYHPEALMC